LSLDLKKGIKMKNSIKSAIACLLIFGAVAQTKAVTTNLVYTVNVAFTVYLQESLDTNDVGSVEVVRGGTKDLIALLGAKSTNSFPPGARLILKRTLGSDSGPQFFVRQGGGTNVVDTDVSAFLSVNNITAVKRSLANDAATRFAILNLVLSDNGGYGDFDVRGFSVEGHVRLVQRGEVLEKESFRGAAAALSGSGDISDIAGDLKPAVLTGTVVAAFKKVEIQ
jgi:hypothetical protein